MFSSKKRAAEEVQTPACSEAKRARTVSGYRAVRAVASFPVVAVKSGVQGTRYLLKLPLTCACAFTSKLSSVLGGRKCLAAAQKSEEKVKPKDVEVKNPSSSSSCTKAKAVEAVAEPKKNLIVEVQAKPKDKDSDDDHEEEEEENSDGDDDESDEA